MRNSPETKAVFEFLVRKAKAPAAQQVNFSTYKNRYTAKMIVGVEPGSMWSYLSDPYGGDQQINECSNVGTKVDPGDSLIADKRFNVTPVNVTVNIPT